MHKLQQSVTKYVSKTFQRPDGGDFLAVDKLSFENLPAYDKVASLPYSPFNCVANARWNCCMEASCAGLLKGTTTMVDILDDEFA